MRRHLGPPIAADGKDGEALCFGRVWHRMQQSRCLIGDLYQHIGQRRAAYYGTSLHRR